MNTISRFFKNNRKAVIVYSTIGVVSIILLFFSVLLLLSEKGSHIAHIVRNGEEIYTIDLSSVTEPYELVITSENGKMNTINVEPGRIGIVHADCPDKVCINTGYISGSLLPIICLPNRLEIYITDGEESGLDGTSR